MNFKNQVPKKMKFLQKLFNLSENWVTRLKSLKSKKDQNPQPNPKENLHGKRAQSLKRKINNFPLKNCGTRNVDPIGIVIHYMSAINIVPDDPYNFNEIIKIYNNYKVSADFQIERDGKIWQLVPDGKYSYHAGVSQFTSGECGHTSSGKPTLNKIAIGIELSGTHTSGFTKKQYESLAWLTGYLMTKYPSIRKELIEGHDAVALPKGRKQDPGPNFNWNQYFNMLK